MFRRLFTTLTFTPLVQIAWVGAVLVAGAACENIGLSVVGADYAANVPSAMSDASAEGGAGGSLGAVAASAGSITDAGVASTSVGNALCFFGYSDGGTHVCEPDTSGQCDLPSEEEAGTFTGWDAGAVPTGSSDAATLSACHVVPNSQICSVAGHGGDGAQCETGADCAASFECVGTPGQCRHYCCDGNDSCEVAANETTGTTFCDVQSTAPGGRDVPVCEPVRSCTLLLSGTGNGSCPTGETCAVVKDDGTTSCVAIGTVGIGGDCDVYHCAADLTCLGFTGSRTCFQLCEVNLPGACPVGTTCTSSAQLFTNANVGICQ